MAQTNVPHYPADAHVDFCRDWAAAAQGSTSESLRAWLEKERPHLLRAYDADFLVQAIESTRARQQASR